MTAPRGVAPVWLDPDDPDMGFPDVESALQDPNGLLAIGGDLSLPRLLAAYRSGIFPWYSEGQPVLWWAPDPRLVLLPGNLHISRNLRKTVRKKDYSITMDTDFGAVIKACAVPRADQSGTWITPEMAAAYHRLHEAGYAHSVECRHEGELVGGLYGVAIGRIFFGESMFARMTDASKVAFVYLVRQLHDWGFPLIDCQVATRHLVSLGATTMPRQQFQRLLAEWCALPDVSAPWALDPGLRPW